MAYNVPMNDDDMDLDYECALTLRENACACSSESKCINLIVFFLDPHAAESKKENIFYRILREIKQLNLRNIFFKRQQWLLQRKYAFGKTQNVFINISWCLLKLRSHGKSAECKSAV